MPRNSAGTYSLDSSNPVVADTTILADGWANPTLTDIANALTDSLDRYGRGGMLAPMPFVDGTESAPSITWNNEPTMGFYRAGAGDMRTVVGGQDKSRVVAAGLQDLRDSAWYRVASAKNFKASDETVGTLISDDGALATTLMFNEAVALATTLGGIQATAQPGSEGLIGLVVSDDNNADFELKNSEGWSFLRQAATAQTQLISFGAAGVSPQEGWHYTHEAEFSASFAGVAKLATTSKGSLTTGDTHKVDAGADFVAQFQAVNTLGGAGFQVRNATGQLQLRQLDDAGADENAWAVFTRDEGGIFYHTSVQRLATVGATANADANSGGTVSDASGAQRSIGFNEMPLNTVSASRDVADSDNGERLMSTTNLTINVPNGALPVGGVVVVTNTAGTLTITSPTLAWFTGNGVDTASSRTVETGGVVTLQRRDPVTVDIWGSGIS